MTAQCPQSKITKLRKLGLVVPQSLIDERRRYNAENKKKNRLLKMQRKRMERYRQRKWDQKYLNCGPIASCFSYELTIKTVRIVKETP